MPTFRALLFFAAAAAMAQNPPGTIQAVGSATISFTPNQAQFTVGVVTQGATAQDAAQQNANISTAVQTALKNALGTNGNLQTTFYSVVPRYSNAPTPAIVGYTATNTVLVTTYNLNAIGSLIDTATQAGANNIGGVSFGLQNPDPYVQQALTAATKQALARAGAIAAGLGGSAGKVVSAVQGSAYTPIVAGPVAGSGDTTPIQTGMVSVSANVTVVVQLVQ